jgi:ABC-type phosphate transport system permease subunit
MLSFIAQRLFQAVIVMVSVAFISFLLFQFVGDPVVFLLGQDATPEQIRELRADLGLDKSFLVQFWNFLANAVRGEFGLSLRQGSKVSRLIAERLPATLELAAIAALLALVLGIPMGVYAALKRGTFLSQVFMTVSLLGVSLPTFLVGILLILLFAVGLGWFPSFGRGDVVQIGWWSSGLLTAKGWHHIVLPAITLAVFQLTLIMRLVRAETLAAEIRYKSFPAGLGGPAAGLTAGGVGCKSSGRSTPNSCLNPASAAAWLKNGLITIAGTLLLPYWLVRLALGAALPPFSCAGKLPENTFMNAISRCPPVKISGPAKMPVKSIMSPGR